MRRDVVPALPTTPQAKVADGEWALHLPFQTQLSLNARQHWAVKAKHTKEWRDAAHVLARAARIPACARIRVELHYVPATVRRRDEDNLVAMLKPLVDGLVDAGIVPDDTPRYVERGWPVLHPARATLPSRGDARFILRVIAL